MEYRAFRADDLAADDSNRLDGLVSPFNSRTMIGQEPWGFEEEMAPGTWRKTLREGDQVLLVNHDTGKPLARKSAGTLPLKEANRGLEMNGAEVADTTYGRDLLTNVRAGNIGGMSVGMRVIKDEWFDKDGEPSDRFEGTHRVIREAQLIEVSAVTFPAYRDTEIFARDELLAERQEYQERAGKEPYGDVAYADPGYQKDKKKRYPLDSSKHVHAAWSYINQAKNAAKYTASQLAHIKNAIKAAAKKIGMAISNKTEDLDLTGYCPRCGFEDIPVEARDEELEQEPESSTPADDENRTALVREMAANAFAAGDFSLASRLMAEVAEAPVN